MRKNNSKQTPRSREKKVPAVLAATAAQLALDATEGFAFVLAGAKALLELDVELNLVPDRFPDGIGKQ